MKKIIYLCIAVVFLFITNTVRADFESYENEQFKPIITQQDIAIFHNYILTHPMKVSPDGKIMFEYMYYSTEGACSVTSYTNMTLLLSQDVYLNSAIHKFQSANHEKIEFIPPQFEDLICKYYSDVDIEANKSKNVPKGNIKIPYITAGNLKVAKKDLAYKPIVQSPFKNNYWAGAREACLAQGMRLPSKTELEQLYENRALFGLDFSKDSYWVSEEISSCFAYFQDFKGVTVHSSREVKISNEANTEFREYLRKNHIKLTADEKNYYEVFPGIAKKNSDNILLRCVR